MKEPVYLVGDLEELVQVHEAALEAKKQILASCERLGFVAEVNKNKRQIQIMQISLDLLKTARDMEKIKNVE